MAENSAADGSHKNNYRSKRCVPAKQQSINRLIIHRLGLANVHRSLYRY